MTPTALIETPQGMARLYFLPDGVVRWIWQPSGVPPIETWVDFAEGGQIDGA